LATSPRATQAGSVRPEPEDSEPESVRHEPEVEEAFDRLVSEGSDRLARPLVPLLATAWSALGNIIIGGVGLVTSIRLLRVPHRVAEERAESEAD
jgi:hypothetical protein